MCNSLDDRQILSTNLHPSPEADIIQLVVLLYLLCLILPCQAKQIVGQQIVPKQFINTIIKGQSDNTAQRLMLMDTSLFDDVQVTNSRITITEAPIVTNIKYKGLATKQIVSAVTGLGKGMRISKQDLVQYEQALKSYFATKNTQVESVITLKPGKSAGVNVIIAVKKVDRLSIKRVQIDGLKHISSQALTASIQTTKTSLFSSTYEASLVEKYKRQIINKAKSMGYLDFAINSIVLTDKVLHIKAVEGPHYTIALLEINNTSSYTNPSIKNDFNAGQIQQVCFKLEREAGMKGYYVKVTGKFDRSTQKLTLNMTDITPQVVESVAIQGNKITQTETIMKIADILPGQQLYSYSEQLAVGRLMSSGFFSKAQVKLIKGIAQIKVEEQNTIHTKPYVNLSYGPSAYKVDGKSSGTVLWKIGADYSNANLLGKGIDSSAEIEFANKHFKIALGAGKNLLLTYPGYHLGFCLDIGPYETRYRHKTTDAHTTDKPESAFKQPRTVEVKYSRDLASIDYGLIFALTPKLTSRPTVSLTFDQFRFTDNDKNNTTLVKPNTQAAVDKSVKSIVDTATQDSVQQVQGAVGTDVLKNTTTQSDTLTSNLAIPRIYNEDFVPRLSLIPQFDWGLRYSSQKLTRESKFYSYSAALMPTITTKATGADFSLSYIVGFKLDSQLKFIANLNAGFRHKYDDKNWIYNKTLALTGFQSIGPKELTSMAPLGGKQSFSGKIKLLIPTPLERIVLFTAFQCGSVGDCGVEPQLIDQNTINRLGLPDKSVDIVNNEHKLRSSATFGIAIRATSRFVLALGYNHPISYNKTFDFTNKLYVNLSYAFETT